MQKDKKYWDEVIGGVNVLMSILKRKPLRYKFRFQRSPGGILNAYREGDVTFDQAVKELEIWKDRELREARLSATRES